MRRELAYLFMVCCRYVNVAAIISINSRKQLDWTKDFTNMNPAKLIRIFLMASQLHKNNFTLSQIKVQN